MGERGAMREWEGGESVACAPSAFAKATADKSGLLGVLGRLVLPMLRVQRRHD
jgi:hypothetical protein